MWKNLLPQGTRTVELCSGYALLIVGALLLARLIPAFGELTLLDKDVSWGFVLVVFGFLQVYSIYEYPRLEILRTAMSWVAGCVWVWIAVVSIDYRYNIEDVATLMLGIGNLYGFIINFNLIHVAWQKY